MYIYIYTHMYIYIYIYIYVYTHICNVLLSNIRSYNIAYYDIAVPFVVSLSSPLCTIHSRTVCTVHPCAALAGETSKNAPGVESPNAQVAYACVFVAGLESKHVVRRSDLAI